MRKLVLAVALALGLTGCAEFKRAVEIATISVANPVTKEMLYDVENSAIVLFSTLNVYRRACLARRIAQTCLQRIEDIQQYTRQVPYYLGQLRVFVKQNDQVNAKVAYNTVVNLITDAREMQR